MLFFFFKQKTAYGLGVRLVGSEMCIRDSPLGIWELLAILAIILLIFGAKRLPEIGASLGRGIRTFKSSVTGEDEEDDKETRAEREPRGADRRSDNNGI